jgi:hypothetical protein
MMASPYSRWNPYLFLKPSIVLSSPIHRRAVKAALAPYAKRMMPFRSMMNVVGGNALPALEGRTGVVAGATNLAFAAARDRMC